MWNTGRMAMFFICSQPAPRVNDSNRDSEFARPARIRNSRAGGTSSSPYLARKAASSVLRHDQDLLVFRVPARPVCRQHRLGAQTS